MAWVALVAGGLFEVGFTTALRYVDGFRNLPWGIAFLVAITLSMALLEYAQRSISLGTAYAVWAGIGSAGTAIVGIALFGESASPARLLLLAGLVGCIVGLKLIEG